MTRALCGITCILALASRAGGTPSGRRAAPVLGSVSSRAPGDVELALAYDAAVPDLGVTRSRFWRVWIGASTALSDAVELGTYVVAQQPSDPAAAARIERLHGTLEFRILGRTPDGTARRLEPKLILEWALPLVAPGDEVPPSVRTAHVLDERVLVGGAAGRWSYGVSLGLAQVFGGTSDDEGVGGTFGLSIARAVPPHQPWSRGTIGIELFGDVAFDGPTAHGLPGDDDLAVYAGPVLGYAVGRMWATIGAYPALAAPEMGLYGRVMFGFAL